MHLKILFILVCVFSFSLQAAAPRVSPMQAVKELDQMVDQYKVGSHLSKADQEFNKNLKQKILRGTFDLLELARLSLDKYWNLRTRKEQHDFVELLTSILEERSVSAKEKAIEKGEQKTHFIQYLGEFYNNKEKTDALVKTIIRLAKQNIQISVHYRLRKNNGEWKIYDVMMDDASLVENYRYSFDKIIRKHGYFELLSRMQKKLDDFRTQT